MKQNKKKNNNTNYNELLINLESIHNALEKHNINLAKILIDEYYEKIPLKIIDKTLIKNINEAIEKKDKTLMNAVIEAEIEKIRALKIKNL